MAKQSVPLRAVKRRFLWRAVTCAAGAGLLTALVGCASTWHHPRKAGAEAAADERECSQRAEENALQRAGRQRADYRLGTPDPNPGMSRGPSPMEMVDRRETQDGFSRDFESCMTSKGYTKD